jgi:hypothetical protein
MVEKERDEVRRLRQVVELATSDDCVRRATVRYR